MYLSLSYLSIVINSFQQLTTVTLKSLPQNPLLGFRVL
jgi:hypothetical protein